jgi:ferredoxin-NADP reductase
MTLLKIVLFLVLKRVMPNLFPGNSFSGAYHTKKNDLRGSRRYFSIASSPTEKELMVVTKFAEKSSTFKTELKNIKTGQEINAAGPDGDFVLPKDEARPLVFIAGGIGIAPFRSMVKYLLDTKQKRNIALIYSNNTEEEIAFEEVWDEAAKAFAMKTIYTLTDQNSIPKSWQGRTGYINAEMVKSEVKDFKNVLFYVSGPDPMVRATEKALRGIGVAEKNIIVDYFPGYV